MRLFQRLNPFVHESGGQAREHHFRCPCETLHVMRGQLVIFCVALLALVNHAVDVFAGIVRETDVLILLDQKLRHLFGRPMFYVHLVQLLVVLHDALRAELQHKRVFNLARFRQFLTGHHFVCLDKR